MGRETSRCHLPCATIHEAGGGCLCLARGSSTQLPSWGRGEEGKVNGKGLFVYALFANGVLVKHTGVPYKPDSPSGQDMAHATVPTQ